MELWDLYTEDRQLTGKDIVRGEDIPKGYFHLVVHVWIRNSRGQYLISQRSASRPTFPLMWECVCGSVLKGENSRDGAVREVKEEVGINLPPEEGRLLNSVVRKDIQGKKYNDILDIWLFEHEGEAVLDRATSDEVAQSMWMDKRQIKKMIDEGKMMKSLEYCLNFQGKGWMEQG